jgi:hypothetical protein
VVQVSLLTAERSPKATLASSGDFLRQHWADIIIVVVLMLAAYLVRSSNFLGYPGIELDEGIYTQQAWSIPNMGQLAPDGYKWDHPFLGWLAMAGWFVFTGALSRYPQSAIFAGREFIVFVAVLTLPLLYLLCRRLGMRKSFGVLACVLWLLSPLAMSFTRLVYLDNIAVPFLLASLVLLLSPSRKLWTVIASGICFVLAFWSKEIFLLALPGYIYMAWRHFRNTDNTKELHFQLWRVVVLGVLAFPAFALLIGDFGGWWHGQVLFQLLGRANSGSVFTSGDQAHYFVQELWLPLDKWLPLAGAFATLPALFINRLRGPAIILATHVLLVLVPLRFLPIGGVIIMLPFMALAIAGVLDVVWPKRDTLRQAGRQRYVGWLRIVVVVSVAVAFFAGGGSKSWSDSFSHQATAQETQSHQQAVEWARQNLTAKDTVVTDYQLWLDLVRAGVPHQQVLNQYQFDHELTDEQRSGVTYLLMSQDAFKGDGPLATLAKSSQSVVVFGADGPDYLRKEVLRTPGHSG